MYSNSDLGRYQQADRMREAAAFRRAAATSAMRAGEGRATLRRVLSAAASVLLWPIRH